MRGFKRNMQMLLLIVTHLLRCTTVLAGNSFCLTGENQSPIIIKDNTKRVYGRVILRNYKMLATFVNAHYENVTVKYPKDIAISVTMDEEKMSEFYKFHHIHFHPGCSEHKINDERYVLEAHMVHFNEKYESFTVAKTEQDGLLVIAILYKKIPYDMIRCKHLDVAFGVDRHNISLYDLLPVNWTEYYTYRGSLTTKNCDESVRWMVIKQPWYVCKYQLETLQAYVKTTCRSSQRLNGRTVYLVNIQEDKSSASINYDSIWIAIFFLILLKFVCA